jgi:hypothetical protein
MNFPYSLTWLFRDFTLITKSVFIRGSPSSSYSYFNVLS